MAVIFYDNGNSFFFIEYLFGNFLKKDLGVKRNYHIYNATIHEFV